MHPYHSHKRDIFFGFLLMLFFGAVFLLHHSNVYFKDGASAIYRAKLKAIKSKELTFGANKKKIIFIGNSKILAGIQPLLFDSLFAQKTSSLNLALGGKSASDGMEMLTELDVDFDILVIHDNFPFYSIDQPETQNFLKFNNYFKDIYYFFVRSKVKGVSFVEWYNKTREECQRMIEDKGYYFIESQAEYSNLKLPEDYRLVTDTPLKEYQFPITNFISDDKFIDFIKSNKLTVFVIPNYFRKGEFMESQKGRISNSQKKYFEKMNIHYLDSLSYYSYPNSNYSDHTHLNEYGARIYTRDVFYVLKNYIGIQ